jgi:hypothetical protein
MIDDDAVMLIPIPKAWRWGHPDVTIRKDWT